MRSLPFVLVLALGAAATAAAQDYTSPDALQKLIADKSAPYALVDVRTAEEFAQGHLPTAVNIPYETIASRPPTQDKQALIIVYCRSGSRSHTAQAMLQKAGYTKVVDFGSIGRWKGEIVAP